MAKRIKQRADITLVERSLVDSRSTAQSLIRAGRVLANEIRLDPPGQLIDQNADIRLISKPKYVSRGGEKLEGALIEKINLARDFLNQEDYNKSLDLISKFSTASF